MSVAGGYVHAREKVAVIFLKHAINSIIKGYYVISIVKSLDEEAAS